MALGETMEVDVKLSAFLRKGRFGRQAVDVPDGSTVGDLLQQLNLPEKKVAVVAVNSEYAAHDRKLQAGDAISIYPPVAGG